MPSSFSDGLPFFLACASGYVLLWVIGKYIYHVCPACAVNGLNEQTGKELDCDDVMVALAIHCTMDGLGIVFGDNLLLGHPDAGLLAGLSVHKVPEGFSFGLALSGRWICA
jgi:zinc transporter ZupT